MAEMSSPRSAQLSAIQGLRILFLELENASAVSEQMIAAQEKLARTQSRAGKLIGGQDDVRRVKWVLDESWLRQHSFPDFVRALLLVREYMSHIGCRILKQCPALLHCKRPER